MRGAAGAASAWYAVLDEWRSGGSRVDVPALDSGGSRRGDASEGGAVAALDAKLPLLLGGLEQMLDAADRWLRRPLRCEKYEPLLCADAYELTEPALLWGTVLLVSLHSLPE